MKKSLSLVLILSLLFSLSAPLSYAENGDSYVQDIQVGIGLTYSEETEDYTGYNRLQSFAFDYAPNTSVLPIVEYGTNLYGKSNINTVVKHAENNGYSVLGAVNADFFNMTTGIPTGIVIKNGALISSDGQWNGVAFSKDGKAYAGTPYMGMTMTSKSTGEVFPIYALNKDRTGNGIHLFNGSYASDTKTSLGGTMVVLEKSDPSPLKIGERAEFTVVSVGWKSGSEKLSDTQYVMTYNDSYKGQYDISVLTVGEKLEFFSSALEPFENAEFATGGGDMLAIDGSLTQYAVSGTAPRTVMGVKEDGSFKIYAVDGRQAHTSVGLSLKDCAQMLIDQGYTDVINLDGGGSTAITVQMPGDTDCYVTNSPSEGSLRNCATYILFVNKTSVTNATKGQVYPMDGVYLTGSKITPYVLSYDDGFNGHGEVDASFNCSSGSMDGRTYSMPLEAGEVTMKASFSSLNITPAVYTVISAPDRLFMLRNGSVVNDGASISLAASETMELDTLAFYKSRKVESTDSDYSWTVTGNCGTVDEDGTFTASSSQGTSGTLTLSAGSKSVTVNIKVGSEPYQIENFENGFNCSVVSTPENTASALVDSNLDNVRFGKKSLALSSTGESAIFTLPFSVKSGTKNLSFWYKITGESSVYLEFVNDGTTVSSVKLENTANWKNQLVSIPYSSASVTVRTEGNVIVYLDNVFGIYDSSSDTTPPVIQLIGISDGNYNISIYDETVIPLKSVRLTVDGKSAACNYTESNRALSFTAPSDGKPHRISVFAEDFYGNLSKASFDIAPEQYDIVFTDMTDSWAKAYVSVLTSQGIFSETTLFNPMDNASNEMVATMISRYLGVDTSLYNDVELPFKDAEKISEWALPHVKALYSLGIMKGSVTEEGNVFLPQNSISRAQVMTILGRTLDRGYSYTPYPIGFDDDGDIPYWSYDHIALLKSLGIVTGYGGANVVKPLNNITRVEVASLLYKLY